MSCLSLLISISNLDKDGFAMRSDMHKVIVEHPRMADVLFEETTGTLLCGDLFTQIGNRPPLTEADIVEPAMATEGLFR